MSKPLQTLALLGTLRTLLFLFNVVFWASGLALLAVSAWIALKLHRYLELDTEIASGLPVFFGGLGIAIVLLASLACQCSLKGNAPKIYIYSTLLFVLFACELAVLGFGWKWRQSLNAAFHNGLGRGLAEYGKDPDRTAAIDEIQTALQCCGVSNYSDWRHTPWGRGHAPDKLPHSCCRWTAQAICSEGKHTEREAWLNTVGCYRLVLNFVQGNVKAIGVGVGLAAVLHVLGIVLACCLARNVSKAEYEELR